MSHGYSQATLADQLCHLRQRLLDARDQNDQATLVELLRTFDLLRASAWKNDDERLASLVEDMLDATQDSLMGVGWKSDIPSVEAIKAL